MRLEKLLYTKVIFLWRIDSSPFVVLWLIFTPSSFARYSIIQGGIETIGHDGCIKIKMDKPLVDRFEFRFGLDGYVLVLLVYTLLFYCPLTFHMFAKRKAKSS